MLKTPCAALFEWRQAEVKHRRPARPTARRSGRRNNPVREDSTEGKKTTGVKRHACVDTLGLIWGLEITHARISDTKGAMLAVAKAQDAAPTLELLWADSAYRGFVEFALLLFRMVVSIVSRPNGTVGFVLLPKRWVVERTFGWLTRWRRLNRNYEHTIASSEAVVQIAMIGIMTRRLAKIRRRSRRQKLR